MPGWHIFIPFLSCLQCRCPLEDISKLEITRTEDLIAHKPIFINETISEQEPIEGEIYETSQSINGPEQTQSVDMDVSTVVDTPIEENVPLTLIRRFSAFSDPATRNVLIQNVNPKRRLLQPGYEQHIADSMGVTAKFQDIVKEERFICNKGKILELFKYCDVPSCKSLLVQVKSKKLALH